MDGIAIVPVLLETAHLSLKSLGVFASRRVVAFPEARFRLSGKGVESTGGPRTRSTDAPSNGQAAGDRDQPRHNVWELNAKELHDRVLSPTDGASNATPIATLYIDFPSFVVSAANPCWPAD